MKVLLRRLARRRLETSLVVAQIALGSVFCLGAVSWLLRQVLEPLPVRDVDRLVLLSGLATVESSDPVEWWGRMKSLERSASYGMAAAVVEAGGRRAETPVAMVSPGFFRTLGADLVAGREFLPEEERRGAPVAVLSDAAARWWFGSPGDAVGGAVRISGRSYDVIGVAKPGFVFPPGVRVWLPRSAREDLASVDRTAERGTEWALEEAFVGRIRKGFTEDAVRQEAYGLLDYLNTVVSGRTRMRYGDLIGVRNLRAELVAPYRRFYWLLLIAAAGVVLVSILNTSLLLAGQTVERRHEFAIRVAVGAAPSALLRQVALESMVMGAAGGLAGVGCGLAAAALLSRDFHVAGWMSDLRGHLLFGAILVLGFAAPAGGALAGMLAGVRTAANAGASLAQAALSPGLTRGNRRIALALLAAQAAAGFCLLDLGFLLLRGASRHAGRDVGFEPAGVAAATLRLGRHGTAGEQDRAEGGAGPSGIRAAALMLARHLDEVPGAGPAAVTDWLPAATTRGKSYFVPVGEESLPVAAFRVTPGFFQTLGIPLLRGRDFSDADQDGVVISESLERARFGANGAIGHAMWIEGVRQPQRVIGVAGNIATVPFGEPLQHQIYLPFGTGTDAAAGQEAFLLVRCGPRCREVLPAAARAAEEAGGTGCCYDWSPFEERLARSGRPLFVRSAVLAAAAALSLLMLALGIFSATARSAGARAGEAGVRMALGATPLDIVGWLQRDALLACLLGLAAGGAASVFLRGLTAVDLIDVPRFDPAATAAAAAVVLASVLLSALPPSLSLARRPPMEVLRQL
ncbi:MAG: ABC transporter permease [Bryobacteraceae bacterium]